MKEFIKNHRALTITVTVILVLVVMTVAGVAAILPHGGRTAAGVSSNGIKLDGMTEADIIAALESSSFYDDVLLTFKGEPDVETVPGADIGLSVDVEATAKKAIGICRYAGFLENIKEAVRLRIKPMEFAPVAKVDREKLGEIIYQRGVRKNGEMKGVEQEMVSDTEILLKPATPGQGSDVDEEIALVLSMIERGEYDDIELDLPKETPEPLTAESLAVLINREPENAEYRLDEKKLYIKEEVVGIKLADNAVSEKLALLNSGEEVTVTVEQVLPEITAESIKGELFGAELSNYSSSYATSTANRAHNVARAAASINGTILLPGEVFSYNAAIGNPSLANGYKMATVFSNGKQTEGVGGGVCQVSSTLYSAALYADLEIVQRRSHSLTVAYVPKGQDATVVYGGQDFKFKNNTASPIKIEATASGGVCRVRIFGAKADANKKVEIVNSINSTVSPTVIETLNKSLPAGTRKVTSSGKTGYNVSTVRIVYENGKEVRRERLTNSTYKMVPTEVTVGPESKPLPSSEPSVPAAGTADEPIAQPSSEPESEPSPLPTVQPTATPSPTPTSTIDPTPEVPQAEPSSTPNTANIE